MGGRHDVDAALGVGPPIDPDLMTMQSEMLVLQVEPAVALLEELLLVAGPKPVGDLAGFHAQRLPVVSDDRDPLWPESVLRERPQRRHQVDMRIARLVVIDPVRDLPARQHLLDHELAHQRDVLLGRQLDGQRDDELLGELRIRPLLEGLDLVPEHLRGAGDGAIRNHGPEPGGRVGRDLEFLMDHPALVGIVDGAALGLALHFRAMPVGGSQDGAAAIAASDELGREMGDGHGWSDP